MSIDSRFDRPGSDLQRWYSGYLLIERLPEDVVRQLADLAKEVPSFEVTSKAIELEYKGRDSSGVILRTLLRLARLIRNANGEVRCEVTGNTDQLSFEFYRIRDGRLFRRLGEVVRQPEQEITESGL
jgi:hypothetical protein